MHIDDLLKRFVEQDASDIHLHANMPPAGRKSKKLIPVGQAKLSPEYLESLIDILCNEEQKEIFAEKQQLDLAYVIPDYARFRVNMFRQQGSVSAVFRVINADESQLAVVNIEDSLIEYLCNQEKGLILVTGPTGSGKSTTMSRVIDEINKATNKMIVTVEDPIEYVHTPKQSIIVQRELGKDVQTFSEALVGAMRQDPDVIMIGEIRDYHTAAAALEAAQTGHLVISTMHTIDTVRTVTRMMDLFPPHEQVVARTLFAESLVAVLSQMLLPKAGGGRIAAVEVLKGTLRVRDLVKDAEKTHNLYDAIRDAKADGMILFDDLLAQYYAKGLIEYDVGLRHATSQQSFVMAATQSDLNDGFEDENTDNYEIELGSLEEEITGNYEEEEISEGLLESIPEIKTKKERMAY